MITVRKRVVALFVDKSASSGWCGIPEAISGLSLLWKKAWDHRQPLHPTEQSELEAVPRHYIHMLDLTF
jgi:hypothetical protein